MTETKAFKSPKFSGKKPKNLAHWWNQTVPPTLTDDEFRARAYQQRFAFSDDHTLKMMRRRANLLLRTLFEPDIEKEVLAYALEREQAKTDDE